MSGTSHGQISGPALSAAVPFLQSLPSAAPTRAPSVAGDINSDHNSASKTDSPAVLNTSKLMHEQNGLFLFSSVMVLLWKSNTLTRSGCGPSLDVEHADLGLLVHAFCKGTVLQQHIVDWWRVGSYTWEGRTPPVHQYWWSGPTGLHPSLLQCERAGQFTVS
jgi:hypothetical protein